MPVLPVQMRAEVCWLWHIPNSVPLEGFQRGFDLMSHMDIHVLQETAALIHKPHRQTRGFLSNWITPFLWHP